MIMSNTTQYIEMIENASEIAILSHIDEDADAIMLAYANSCTDDDPETVLSRLHVYHQQTEPLIDFYTQRGLLRHVDGAQPMDECYAAILEALGEKK